MNKAKCDVLLIRAIYKILKKFLNFEAIKLLKAKTTLNFANDSTGDRRSAGYILPIRTIRRRFNSVASTGTVSVED